jgi:hypothetical protein
MEIYSMLTQWKKCLIPVAAIGLASFSGFSVAPSFAKDGPTTTSLESLAPVPSAEQGKAAKLCNKTIANVSAKASGNRASGNFNLPVRVGQLICIKTSRAGIVFNLKDGRPGRNSTVASGVRTGVYRVVRPIPKGIYVSNPRGTNGRKFTVLFKG